MSLKDKNRNKRKQRQRQKAAVEVPNPINWCLYKTSLQNVPKDLLEMLEPLIRNMPSYKAQIKKKRTYLNKVEIEKFRRTFNFIEINGIENVENNDFSDSDDVLLPVIEKLQGDSYKGIYELKISNTQHNPRILFCKCEVNHSVKAVFLSAFKKEQQHIPESEKKRALTRYKDLKDRKDRGVCS